MHTLEDKKVLVLTVGCINYDHDINHLEPIQRIFTHVLRYNYYQRFQELGRESMNRELLSLAIAEKPDYIFYITYQNQVMLKTLEKLRKLGITLIGWFSDDQWRFEAFSKNLAKYLEFPVTTCHGAYEAYKTLGFHPIFCQWGSNPRYYKPKNGAKKRYDVTFVGGSHGGRSEFLNTLVKEGVAVSTFGRGWNKTLAFNSMVRLYCESRINLNFSTSSVDENVKQIKGRVFEIPMCGGFLLTEYAPGLEEWFEIDMEIACFSDRKEAAEKIRYYLSHEAKRERIAQAGYRRAVNCHSWDTRLIEVFRTVQERETTLAFPRPSLFESVTNRLFCR